MNPVDICGKCADMGVWIKSAVQELPNDYNAFTRLGIILEMTRQDKEKYNGRIDFSNCSTCPIAPSIYNDDRYEKLYSWWQKTKKEMDDLERTEGRDHDYMLYIRKKMERSDVFGI